MSAKSWKPKLLDRLADHPRLGCLQDDDHFLSAFNSSPAAAAAAAHACPAARYRFQLELGESLFGLLEFFVGRLDVLFREVVTVFLAEFYEVCESSANRRLKRWMKKHGWNRTRTCHEMRSYNGAMVTTMTGSLYEAQKRLRHASSRTTEKSYADLVAHNTDAVSFPKAS